MFGEGSLFEGIIGLAVLLVSIVIHENAHGVVALWLGDDTAKKMGRLTLNPIKHLDIVGSIIIPAALYFSGMPMFGYAKPVPVVPSRLRGTDRAGFATVAAAGPLSNFILAFIAALAFRALKPVPGSLLFTIVSFGLIWNITLAAFNLLPIPPLDGSRFLRLFVSEQGRRRLDQIEPYGFLILFGLIFFLEEPLFKVVDFIQNFLLKLLPI
jgi:Zn-dependent protease